MEKSKTWDLVALASIPLMMTLGSSMLIPVLPTIEKKINISNFQSSMIITIYSIVSIIFIPFAGYLSDQFGRKKVIIPSLIITGIGGVISGLAAWQMKNPYWMILLGRLVQGLGASGAFPVVIPTVGDMFKQDSDVSKGLGIIETSNTFGKVLTPIVGSALAAWTWFVPFLSIPLFSLVSIILVLLFVKVPKKEQESSKKNIREFLAQIKDIFKKNGKWLYAIFLVGYVCLFVLFGFRFYFSSILEDRYNINGIKKGFIMAIPLLSLCVTSYLTGKLVGQKKVLMKWVILGGNVIATGALVWLGFSENYILLIITLSIAGVGIGAALPCLDVLITEGIEKSHRGTITSFYSSARILGVALGPPVTALLMKSTKMILFIALAAANVIAAIITLFFIKPSRNPR